MGTEASGKERHDALARETLDTLPLNVAVIDGDGTILLTNRAWDEFGGVGSGGGDMVGRNYFDAIDTGEDEHASEALSGLREVVAGEREIFTLEYPCHTPDQQQWFMMRATPLDEDSDGDVVVAHIDITTRKLAEIRTREQQAELEHLLGRLQGLVGDVMEAVLLADSRSNVERTVCERLVEVDRFTAAWVGRVDMRTEALVPAAGTRAADRGTSADGGEEVAAESATSAGDDEGSPAEAGVPDWLPAGGVPPAADDPIAKALDRRAPEVRRDGEGAGEWATHATLAADGASMAAFPLVYGETEYGVLVVYASDSAAVDESEFAVLETLARAVSTAIHAVEGRRIFADDSVVEVELTLDDEGPFFRDLSTELSCRLSYEGSLYGEGGGVAMLFVATDVDSEALLAAARARDDVESARLGTATEDRAVLEVTVETLPLVDAAAESGADTTSLVAEEGQVSLTLELPAGADTRAVVEGLAETYPSISLVARRERERTEQTKAELVGEIESELTDRQRVALEKAYLGGFFDWPRDVSGEDLAQSMDISPSTYHQHLRAAERKVLDALFGD